MRHVDEGTIHAWLDRQVTDPAEAAWVAEHLRVCAACAARLADERATLEQADALLAGVAPVADTGRPEFDVLVARSNASAPASDVVQRSNTRMKTWLIPASWAASIALAFAIGWSVRDPAVREAVREQTPPEVPAAVPSSDREMVTPASSTVVRSEAPQQRAPSEESRRDVPALSKARLQRTGNATGEGPAEVSVASPLEIMPNASVAETGRLNQLFAPQQGGGQGQGQGQGAAPAPVPVNVATGIPQPAVPPVPGFVGASSTGSIFSGAPAGGGGGGGGRGGRAGGGTQGRILVDGMVVGTGLMDGISTDTTVWRTVPRTQAAVSSGMPVYGIDGLTPAATMLSADNTIVRTVYRLDSGETVDVTQRRLTNPSVIPNPQGTVVAEAPVVDVQNARVQQSFGRAASPSVWSTERDGLRLTLRGPANLPALAERLRVD